MTFETLINDKHTSLINSGSNIGDPITEFTPIGQRRPTGGFRDFQNGSIYISLSTQAQMITGLIRDLWRNMGAQLSPLGYPITDEVDGSSRGVTRYNDFKHGTIVWRSGENKAFAVVGVFFEKWAQLNFASGPMGYPSGNQFEVTNTEMQMTFDHGTIWNDSKYGTNIIFNNQVCVTNNTEFNATIRFYNITDSGVLGLSITLPDGEQVVNANSSLNWSLPAGVTRVKVTFDGNFKVSSFQIVAGGGHITFSQDQRILIKNKSDNQGTLRFYRSDLLIRLFTLPNGEVPIGAHDELFWTMPQELIDVIVTFNNIEEQFVFRGGIVEFNIDDKIHFINNSAARVRFLLFNNAVPSRLFTLPGGDVTIDPGGQATYIVPVDVMEVSVVSDVRPIDFFSDNRNSIVAIPAIRGAQIIFP